jgi:segregation and condensation protein A
MSTGINIKLEKFEGPLDLLLHLIEKAEVDIYEIPIAQITDQYLQILEEVKEQQLEIASEFLVMAATLLAIKSRMLLPKQEVKEENESEEEWLVDPQEQLVERLLEYKRYKRLGEWLREREAERSKVYTRLPIDFTPYKAKPSPMEGITADLLLQVFVDLLRTEQQTSPLTKVAREEISVSARINEIEQQLFKEKKLVFSKLLGLKVRTKEWIITTFLALLELMKAKQIVCYQGELFGEIFIEWVDPGA